MKLGRLAGLVLASAALCGPAIEGLAQTTQGSVSARPTLAQKLAALQAALQLQPRQEPAWQAYVAAAETARADRAAWRVNNPSTEGMTLPQRIDRRQSMRQALSTDRQTVDTALKQLYASLTPTQQIVMEIHFARQRHHHHRMA